MDDPTRSRRAKAAISAAILLVAAALLVALDHHGKASRTFADGTTVLEVSRPQQADDVWLERGLRGRTLLVFGAFPHPWRSSGLGRYQRGPDGVVRLKLRGPANGRTVLLRGDMDALPLTEDTGLPFSSQHDGAMHACGHDTHVAMLAGAARALCERRDRLTGSVMFMF